MHKFCFYESLVCDTWTNPCQKFAMFFIFSRVIYIRKLYRNFFLRNSVANVSQRNGVHCEKVYRNLQTREKKLGIFLHRQVNLINLVTKKYFSAHWSWLTCLWRRYQTVWLYPWLWRWENIFTVHLANPNRRAEMFTHCQSRRRIVGRAKVSLKILALSLENSPNIPQDHATIFPLQYSKG